MKLDLTNDDVRLLGLALADARDETMREAVSQERIGADSRPWRQREEAYATLLDKLARQKSQAVSAEVAGDA